MKSPKHEWATVCDSYASGVRPGFWPAPADRSHAIRVKAHFFRSHWLILQGREIRPADLCCERFMRRKVRFIWRSQQDHVPPAAQGTRPLRIPSCCRRGFITSNMNEAHPTPISGTGTAGGRVGVLHMGGMNLVTAQRIPKHKGSACRL